MAIHGVFCPQGAAATTTTCKELVGKPFLAFQCVELTQQVCQKQSPIPQVRQQRSILQSEENSSPGVVLWRRERRISSIQQKALSKSREARKSTFLQANKVVCLLRPFSSHISPRNHQSQGLSNRNILLGQKIKVHTDHENLTYKTFNFDHVM